MVVPSGAGEGNQVAAAATRRPGERSNRPARPPTPDLELAGEKKLRQEAAGGVFRSGLDPQHPWTRGLETSSGCRRSGHLRHY